MGWWIWFGGLAFWFFWLARLSWNDARRRNGFGLTQFNSFFDFLWYYIERILAAFFIMIWVWGGLFIASSV